MSEKVVWTRTGEYQCGCGSTIAIEVGNHSEVTMSISEMSVRCGACNMLVRFTEVAVGSQFRISLSEKTRVAEKAAEKVGTADER